MRQKSKTGIVMMLFASFAIILACMACVWIFGQAAENTLISQVVDEKPEIQIGGEYLEVIFPWEGAKEEWSRADETDVQFIKDSGMEEALNEAAELLMGIVELDAAKLWIDEAGRLIYQPEQKNVLSFAIDRDNGIIGFGISPVKEKDMLMKVENVKELVSKLDDPIHELYTITPLIEKVLAVYEQGNQLEFMNSENAKEIFSYMSEFERQVLYENDVLEVIIKMKQKYVVMEYNPDTERFTSYLSIDMQ